MKLPDFVKNKVKDIVFKYVLLPCVGIGFIVFCYLFSCMFDDKQTYDGGASGFFQWLKDTTVNSIEEALTNVSSNDTSSVKEN